MAEGNSGIEELVKKENGMPKCNENCFYWQNFHHIAALPSKVLPAAGHAAPLALKAVLAYHGARPNIPKP